MSTYYRVLAKITPQSDTSPVKIRPGPEKILAGDQDLARDTRARVRALHQAKAEVGTEPLGGQQVQTQTIKRDDKR